MLVLQNNKLLKLKQRCLSYKPPTPYLIWLPSPKAALNTLQYLGHFAGLLLLCMPVGKRVIKGCFSLFLYGRLSDLLHHRWKICSHNTVVLINSAIFRKVASCKKFYLKIFCFPNASDLNSCFNRRHVVCRYPVEAAKQLGLLGCQVGDFKMQNSHQLS